MKKIDYMTIPIKGRLICLRDAVPDDLPHFQNWQQSGEWREYDAPWERSEKQMTNDKAKEVFERCYMSELDLPRKRLIIETTDNYPIGWVNRYGSKRFKSCCNIGIAICDDTQLNHGCGTEALKLWINHIFSCSDFHRIAFATYSFNSRVIRLAEKLSFFYEGQNREIVQWQGKWHNRLHFSLLRREWESRI